MKEWRNGGMEVGRKERERERDKEKKRDMTGQKKSQQDTKK